MKTLVLTLILTGAFFAGYVLSFGGSFGVFTPEPLLIMVLFPLVFQFIVYGSFLKKAFATMFEKAPPKDCLRKAYSFFKHYGQTIWITAITLIALYAVICVKYLEDKSGLGPMFQFALNTIIYAGLLHLIIVLPYKAIIRNKFISSE
jgi:hypothetical protein